MSPRAARRWFGDYVNDAVYRRNGYDNDIPGGGSAQAAMTVYPSQHSETPLMCLQAAPNPGRGFRVIDNVGGDPIDRGVEQAGLNIIAVADGYLAALLALQEHPDNPTAASTTSCSLGRHYSERDICDPARDTVFELVRHMLGTHPLAARRYARIAGERALGWDLYLEQTRRSCGFTGRTGDPALDSYMPNLAYTFERRELIPHGGLLVDADSEIGRQLR